MKPLDRGTTCLTKRQKQRLLFFPLMAFLLLISIGLVVGFEHVCSSTYKLNLKLEMNYVVFNWIRWSNYLLIIFLFGATLGVAKVKNPVEIASLSFSFLALLLITMSIFAGYHFQFYSHRIRDTGLLRICKMGARNKPAFREREFTWLNGVQNKVGCCGLDNYTDYFLERNNDSNKNCRLNEKNWIHNHTALSFALDIKEQVPMSCCKTPAYPGCNEDLTNNTTGIHTRGCQTIVAEEHLKCLPMFWVMALLPLMVGIPACVISYIFTRHSQGVKWTSFCGEIIRVKDPEIIEEPEEPKEEPKEIKTSSIISSESPYAPREPKKTAKNLNAPALDILMGNLSPDSQPKAERRLTKEMRLEWGTSAITPSSNPSKPKDKYKIKAKIIK